MIPVSPRKIAMLTLLHERGPMNRLDIELALGMPQIDREIARCKRSGFLVSCKKARLEPVKYRITHEGSEVVLRYAAKQKALARPTVMNLPPYVPPQWAPARAGSLAAFALPSRGFSC